MKNINKCLIYDVFMLIGLCCYCAFFCFISFGINHFSEASISTPTVIKDDTINYQYAISYGNFSIEQEFDGQLLFTNDSLTLDKETKLCINKYDQIESNQIIGENQTEKIVTTSNGLVYDIVDAENIVVKFRNYNKTYSEFLIDKSFKDYFCLEKNFTIVVNGQVRYVALSSIEEEGDSIRLKTDYFYYDILSCSIPKLKLSLLKKTNVLKIQNKYLVNKIENNKYLLHIYNPNDSLNPIYDVVISTGLQNDEFTEILSDNVHTYEAIII